MSPRIVLALSAVLLCDGCTVYRTQVRSLPTTMDREVVVHRCPSGSDVGSWPASRGLLCFSTHAVEMEVEAENAQSVVEAIGPLWTLIPIVHRRARYSLPLAIGLRFTSRRPYVFDAWQASLRTKQGETIALSNVVTKFRDAEGDHSMEIARGGPGAPMLSAEFLLSFERPVQVEEEFVLTLHLIAPDGADLWLPIEFRGGKVHTLGVIP